MYHTSDRKVTSNRRQPIARQLRSRAPLRLGLAGGGTDLPSYCEIFGGAVLNVTIDRYAYAHVTLLDDGSLRFKASDIGASEEHRADGDLPIRDGLMLHRGVHRRIVEQFLEGRAISIEVSTTVDAPAGSGLGSSSALVVALVEAYRAAFDLPLGPYDVAHLAYEIERIELSLAGGKQDHYAAAFGGVNFIEFLPAWRPQRTRGRAGNMFHGPIPPVGQHHQPAGSRHRQQVGQHD